MNDTLTIAEAARMAGVSRNTLARAMRDGSVPVPILKIGKCVRVPRARFISWVSGASASGPGGVVVPPAAPPDSQ